MQYQVQISQHALNIRPFIPDRFAIYILAGERMLPPLCHAQTNRVSSLSMTAAGRALLEQL